MTAPAFTYWTQYRGVNQGHVRLRRCTTCGNVSRPADGSCPYSHAGLQGPPQYTGRTPST